MRIDSPYKSPNSLKTMRLLSVCFSIFENKGKIFEYILIYMEILKEKNNKQINFYLLFFSINYYFYMCSQIFCVCRELNSLSLIT